MKAYEEMNVIEYWEAVKEYAFLLGSLAEGWAEADRVLVNRKRKEQILLCESMNAI